MSENPTVRPRRVRWSSGRLWLAALATSALLVVSYAPHDLWPLAFVAFVPLLVALRESPGTERLAFGWLAGAGCTLGGFFWIPGLIVNFGELPLWVGLLAYLALAIQQGTVFALAFPAARWLRQGLGLPRVWAFPVAFVAAESAIPLIFPWRVGYTQYVNFVFIQSADLGGPFLVTFFVVLANAVLAELVSDAIERRREAQSATRSNGFRPSPHALVACVLVLLNVAYGVVRLRQVDAREAAAPITTIGLVEADIPIEEKWDSSLYARNLHRHQAASAALEDAGAELIVWPESAFELDRYFQTTAPVADLETARLRAELSRVIPYDVAWLPATREPLSPSEDALGGATRDPFAALVPQRGFSTPLLTGTTVTRWLSDEESRALPPRGGFPRRSLSYNSALLLDRHGKVEGIGHKVVRMPISEYIPYAVGLYRKTGINLYEIVPSSGLFGAAPGPQTVTLPGDPPLTIGLLNCYEDLMPEFVRQMVNEQNPKPDVLINLTNDAWFGRSAEPIQHFALSTFRSVEARTWLIRATNTGVSAFVDSGGRIIERSSVYDAETLLADVPHLPAKHTLFVRLGSWPAYIAWVLVAASLLRKLWQRRRTSDRQ